MYDKYGFPIPQFLFFPSFLSEPFNVTILASYKKYLFKADFL